MMKKVYKLIVLLILTYILTGCTAGKEFFIIPYNYSGEAVVKIYNEKKENTYNVNIKCRDGNYNLNFDDGETKWSLSVDGDKCSLNNEKFKDNSVVIDEFNMAQSLIAEFDLSKFDYSEGPKPEEIIYWDGTYKHVLNFDKENLLPDNIFIYKNDNLVKTIQYSKLDIE